VTVQMSSDPAGRSNLPAPIADRLHPMRIPTSVHPLALFAPKPFQKTLSHFSV
jgi:hypothetical protein